MTFWDDFSVRAKQLFNLTAEKTTELVDVSKLRLELSSAGAEVRKLYEKLGTVVYQQSKSEEASQEVIAEIITEIDNQIEYMNELKEAIAARKANVVCSCCGEMNGVGAQFCSKCGMKIG